MQNGTVGGPPLGYKGRNKNNVLRYFQKKWRVYKRAKNRVSEDKKKPGVGVLRCNQEGRLPAKGDG